MADNSTQEQAHAPVDFESRLQEAEERANLLQSQLDGQENIKNDLKIAILRAIVLEGENGLRARDNGHDDSDRARSFAFDGSEASFSTQNSDLGYVSRLQHESEMEKLRQKVTFLNTKYTQSQTDAKEAANKISSLEVALQNRGQELNALKNKSEDLQEQLNETVHREPSSSRSAARRVHDFFNRTPGIHTLRDPMFEDVREFASASGNYTYFMSSEAKRLCDGGYVIFTTRDPAMFFPQSHAAHAVTVRATHKFVPAENGSGTGRWEHNKSVSDFAPGITREIFWRVGRVYKYMGTYRCTFVEKMELGDVPDFPGYHPHSIIRNAVKQKDAVSALVTDSVESLFTTGAIHVLCYALERTGYNDRLEHALFNPPFNHAPRPNPAPRSHPFPRHEQPYQPAPRQRQYSHSGAYASTSARPSNYEGGYSNAYADRQYDQVPQNDNRRRYSSVSDGEEDYYRSKRGRYD